MLHWQRANIAKVTPVTNGILYNTGTAVSGPMSTLTPPPLTASGCTFYCPAAGRAAVTQLNYQLIAQDAQIHRSIAQRLITEMLQRLAMHIVAGHAIQVRSGLWQTLGWGKA
jgi:hypothetical protein